jgi:hypothetical protein
MEVIAACHIHSEWSYDAKWTLPALSAKFAARGCRLLMMTEHDRGFTPARFEQFRDACAAASNEQILVVPGIEYSDADNRVHVLTWGLRSFLGENLPTGEMLDGVKAAGGVAVLAHPGRKDVWRTFDPQWIDRLLGIEVWNRKYDGWAPSQSAPKLLAMGNSVPFAGLDFHTQRQSFPLTMVFDVRGTINEENILECLRARRCEARAFGTPLLELAGSVPVLQIAEKGRRTAAAMMRSAIRASKKKSA